MKKFLIFMSALVMLSATACAEKSATTGTPETSTETKNVEVTQLMYKQEHLSFPADMSERMGLYYHDGVKFVYKSKDDSIKIMSYEENMNETGALTLIGADDLPYEACCCAKQDGTIVMFCIYTDYGEITDYEDFYENAVLSPEIRTYSPDGKLLETHEVDGFHSWDDFSFIDGFYEYGENYVISYNGGYALVAPDGEILNMSTESQNNVFATDTDGKPYVCDWKKYCVTDGKRLTIDKNNATEYGKYINRTGSAFRGAGDFKLFMVMNEGIFGIAPNDELIQVMDFTDSNVSPSGIYFACYGGDGKFVICGDDQTLADGMFFDLLTVRPDDYTENKTNLTLGCINWSNNAPEIAMMYSKQSDNYNVEIKKYEDIDNLKLDVLSGEAPDLFAYGEASFMYRYANFGAFADLYGYMENNDGIKQEDILENVLNAYEYKGGLYGIPVAFNLENVYLANSDVISRDYSYWNYEEFFSFAENMPDGMYLGSRNSSFAYRDHTFSNFLCNYSNWIDYDNYTCDFNNEEFIHLLDFCNTVEINEPFNWEKNDWGTEQQEIEYMEDELSVLRKTALLYNTNWTTEVNDFIHRPIQTGLYTEDKCTFLIPPSNDRTGSISTSNDMCFSILTDTDCPEGAWDFMNYILSPYFQNNYLQVARHFTSNKESYEYKMNKDFDEAKKELPTPIDVTANDWGNPETEGITWKNKPLTDSDIDYIMEFISHFTKLTDHDEDVYEIINEEIPKLIAGEATAEQCAEMIQNRVSIYLSEQS
ncbi:MAG: extracellular solute-binding protein [Ruminococcus flavefaciens]|nr:extracellular solute-binding protein [Ruminococcus flavefaciens]